MSKPTRDKSNYHSGSKKRSCYFCDCGPPLDEHHVIPQRFGGPDSKENIVEVCQLCHQRLEALYDKSFFEWFGIEDEQGERTFHRQCEAVDCTNQAAVKVHAMRAYGLLENVANRTQAYRCRPCASKLASEMWQEELRKRVDGDLSAINYDPEKVEKDLREEVTPEEVFEKIVMKEAD